MGVEMVSPDALVADESTPGALRETVFETENAVMVRTRLPGGSTSGWHHHGDRHVYGYIVEGEGGVEYGPGGSESVEGRAGDFFYLSPGTVHRDVNPADEDIVVLVCFVGTGPVIVNVDGPTPG